MRELTIDLPGGARIPARLYEPPGAGDDAPLLVFLHGGGFILGSLVTHANTCRFTAARAGCKILAVGYRKAPEHPFPAALEDYIEGRRLCRPCRVDAARLQFVRPGSRRATGGCSTPARRCTAAPATGARAQG